MSDIEGVKLNDIEETVYYGLQQYSLRTDDRVKFDLEKAARLELTPEKPNSARSVTPVMYLGEVATNIYVIVFAPNDGTGAPGAIIPDNMDYGQYPRVDKVLPRDKAGTHVEANLTLGSYLVNEPNEDARRLAGSLELLGINGPRLVKLADLGQEQLRFRRIMDAGLSADPTATLTTGYHNGIFIEGLGDEGERFGDPHAIYNPFDGILQVCGFVALSDGVTEDNITMMRELKASEPDLIH